ncbi:MAG TPA: hypothetical protein VFF29_01265, partial [Bacteroidota bacterium]|nr:hypothetical protein [Bacteroidota bacterium]
QKRRELEIRFKAEQNLRLRLETELHERENQTKNIKFDEDLIRQAEDEERRRRDIENRIRAEETARKKLELELQKPILEKSTMAIEDEIKKKAIDDDRRRKELETRLRVEELQRQKLEAEWRSRKEDQRKLKELEAIEIRTDEIEVKKSDTREHPHKDEPIHTKHREIPAVLLDQQPIKQQITRVQEPTHEILKQKEEIPEAKGTFSYFENLETTIKLALAVYLVILISGILLVLLEPENIIASAKENQIQVLTITLFIIVGLFFGLFAAISKINWLGELHIWLDRNFFGFLKKSNEVIFQTLLFSLDSTERTTAINLPSDKKDAIAQTIFSRLANDSQLFESLLRTGIFRTWIWYWIMIYGTFIFTLLTTVTFMFVIGGTESARPFLFTMSCILGMIHLALSLVLGNSLVRMTQGAVDSIVRSHRNDIAIMLRTNINEA